VDDARYVLVTRVCVSVHSSHYCTDPDVTWGNGRGCPPVVHYWADLQLVHGFRRYDSIALRVLAISAHNSVVANAKCLRVHACTRSLPGFL